MMVDNASERIWEAGGIILAGAMATLALQLQVNAPRFATAVITTFFAIGAILVLLIWSSMIQRQRELQHVAFDRMRYLQDKLGIEIQRRISEHDREGSKPHWYGIRGTTEMLVLIAECVMVGWVVVGAWRWVMYVANALD